MRRNEHFQKVDADLAPSSPAYALYAGEDGNIYERSLNCCSRHRAPACDVIMFKATRGFPLNTKIGLFLQYIVSGRLVLNKRLTLSVVD